MSSEKKGILGTILVIATFIGRIVGAITGLLSTLQHGGETRKQIREFYNEGVIRGDEFAKKAQEKIPEQRKVLIDILGLINSALSEVPCPNSKHCIETVKRAILSKYQMPEG